MPPKGVARAPSGSAGPKVSVISLIQHLPYYPLVNARKCENVLDRSTFPDLVHGRVRKAEIDDRAELDQEASVRRPAARRELGRHAGFVLDCVYNDIVELPWRREERFARNARPDLGAGSLALGDLLDQLHEILAALEIVEADVELRGRRAGD